MYILSPRKIKDRMYCVHNQWYTDSGGFSYFNDL